MFIPDATLSYDEHDAFAANINKLLEGQNLYDVLCVLARAAVDRIFQIKDEHERLRAGALFLKEFDLLYTLSGPSQERARGKKMPNSQRRSPSLKIAACVDNSESRGVVKLQEPESIMLGLGDLPATYGYDAILQGVPAGIGLILRDYPKECDRDQLVFESIATAVFHRSAKKSEAATQWLRELNMRMKPVTDNIATVRDDRVRNAAILEQVSSLTRLGKFCFSDW